MTFTALAHLTFEQAEEAHRYGRMTDLQWEAYQVAWRRSAPRFSNLAEWGDQQQAPDVEELAGAIMAAAGVANSRVAA